MSRTSLLGATSLLLLGGSLLATPLAPDDGSIVTGTMKEVAPAPRAKSAKPVSSIENAVEIVVFTPQRPVRIRVHITSEGKDLNEIWQEKLRVMFDFFDRNKDGVLNAAEVQNILSDTGLTRLLQDGSYQPTPQDRPTLERLDLDRDGSVSFAEFAAYYKQSSAQVLRSMPTTAENPSNAAATEAIFKLLDTNKDGKLTREEVQAAESLIHKLDVDEDECLSFNELVGNMPNQRGRFDLAAFNPQPPPTTPIANQIVTSFSVGRIPGLLIQQLIKRYDKDGDFELTREECGFDEVTFARLDKDGNGKLDGEELDVWRTGPPDLEVALSYGSKPANCVAKLLTDPQDATARGFKWNQSDRGRLIVRTGRHPIEFWAYSAMFAGQQQATKFQYAYMFTQAAGKKGYVVEKDLTGPNAVQFQFLRVLFDAADADGDGKLTKAEFDAYFDMQDGFRSVSLAVIPAIQTPTLFQLLDENRDGRLSVRELRTAWDRLIVLEPPGSKVVTKAAIQPTVSIRLFQMTERVPQIQFQQDDFLNQNRPPVPQKGPLWFRKMDRNGDGDVSRGEFLGTKEEFDAIDTDHDGLISLEEAEAYDKKMRRSEEKVTPKDPKKPAEKVPEKSGGK